MMKKKFFVLLLSLCLAFSSMLTASAAFSVPENADVIPNSPFEIDPTPSHEEIVSHVLNDPNAIVYNEYDILIAQQAAAREALSKNRMLSSDRVAANLILSIDMKEKVYELQSLSDEELSHMGYSQERIQAIHNFSGTDSELRSLAATCRVSATPTYNEVNGKRWAKMRVSFTWSGVPIWNYTDAVLGQSTSTFLAQRVPDCSATIYYRSDTTNRTQTVSYGQNDLKICPTSTSTSGLVEGFPYYNMKTVYDGSTPGESDHLYAASGTATLVFMSVDDRQVTLFYCNAHATREISGGLSISFSLGSGATAGGSFGLTPLTYSLESGTLDPHIF